MLEPVKSVPGSSDKIQDIENLVGNGITIIQNGTT